jgi:hypothetical protein
MRGLAARIASAGGSHAAIRQIFHGDSHIFCCAKLRHVLTVCKAGTGLKFA